MLQTLVSSAGRFISDLSRAWIRERNPRGLPAKSAVAATAKYPPLRHVTLTDEVSRTLFEEYAAHRQSHRGNEETGWTLLGLRDGDEAIILATLPAGAHCSARRCARSIQQLGPGARRPNPSPIGPPADDAWRRAYAPERPAAIPATATTRATANGWRRFAAAKGCSESAPWMDARATTASSPASPARTCKRSAILASAGMPWGRAIPTTAKSLAGSPSVPIWHDLCTTFGRPSRRRRASSNAFIDSKRASSSRSLPASTARYPVGPHPGDRAVRLDAACCAGRRLGSVFSRPRRRHHQGGPEEGRVGHAVYMVLAELAAQG